MQQTARTEFAQALKALAQDRGLDPSVIIDTMKEAIEAAFRRDARERGDSFDEFQISVEMDQITGETRVFANPIDKPEEKKDVTPPGFGRIAAQTAKQVIHQKIREAERTNLMDEYTARLGGLISGMVLRFDGPNVRIDLGKTEGYMPSTERVPTERLTSNQRLTFLLKSIEETPRGKQIILSRASEDFVSKLFEREVPEIASHAVEIKAIAREAGVRTKIAVYSSQSGVDPVGSCVGQKGVRVQAVTNELGGERVDIVAWTEDAKEYIKASLSPVNVLEIQLDENSKTAIVTVAEDQLSLAIGREGQNVRLASRLTNWGIEVKGAYVESEKVEEVEEESKKDETEEKTP